MLDCCVPVHYNCCLLWRNHVTVLQILINSLLRVKISAEVCVKDFSDDLRLYLKGFQTLMVQIFCGVYGSKLSVVCIVFFLKLRLEGWNSSDKPVQFFQCLIIISYLYSLNTWILTKRHHLL